MIALSRTKHEAAVIRKVFKGEPEAYRYLVEQYQPMVYAVALAHTGNIYLADKVVVATFKDGFDRLVSLTDPKRLGMLLCTVAQGEAEKLVGRRTADWNKPRKREGDPPIDMKWVQSELIDPLNEELGSFTVQERKGILLHAFCGLSVKNIAAALKIERKEAEEDLARTRENIEKALLKEVVNTLYPEVNNKERLVAIMTEVAGPFVAEKAAQETRIGKSKRRLIPMIVAVSTVIVLTIGGYFGYRAFVSIISDTQADDDTTIASRNEGETEPETEGETAQAEAEAEGEGETKPPVIPSNYTIEGRVVDRRFPQDGIPSLKVIVADQETETDYYGAFVIRGVPKGQHFVTIKYGDSVLVENRRMNTEGRNSSVEITVDERIPARFLFQGRVFDRNTKEPIEVFEVATCKDFPDMLQPYLLKRFREQRHPEGIVNDRFVTLGDYTMYVRSRGYAPFPLQFTIDENWDLHRVYEFPLYRSATLEAVVYGPNELSISGAAVMPRQGTVHGTAAGKIDYMSTDSMGRFTLYTLPIGIQSFLIYHIEHGTGRAIVELEPGKTTQIKIQLPRKGALTGDITINGKPAKFSEFKRRTSGSGVDLTRSINYNAPGQYEVVITPEPVTIMAAVNPIDGCSWFDRRMELNAVVVMEEPTWLDFNFSAGPGTIYGDVSLRETAPRAVFVEIVYNLGKDSQRERILYDLGTTSSFRLTDLPLGSGTFHLYASPRSMSKTDFASARALMDRKEQSFELDAANTSVQIDVAL